MLTCLYDVVGLCLAWIYVSMCLFPCYMVRSESSHAYMLGFIFFHVYVLSFYMFTCMFLCLYVQIYVLTCLYAWIYVLYVPYAIFHVLVCSMPCLCAQTQAMFVMPCAIIAILSLCLSLLCFSLMVGTRSRPYGLCHHSYTLAHIKGFGSPLFATPKSSRGASNEPHMRGSVATAGGKIKAHNDGSFLPRSRLSVDITYTVSLKQYFLFIGLERKRMGWE